jgi:salicylate hydroxylase
LAALPHPKSGERPIIVIVGAGIGGLTAALSLSAAGFRIFVAERADHLSEVGAGIQLSPNAGRVLAGLGLDRAIAAAAIEPTTLEIRSGADGQVLVALPIATFRQRYGFPYRVIHRADLQTILANAIAADPSIVLECAATVADTLPQPEGPLVRIRTAHGVDVVPSVAIVAADGVWSTFRQRVAGSATPQATGRTAWRALIPADSARDLIAMDRTALWLGPHAHLVHYPVAKGAAVNVVAIVEERWDKPGWSAVGESAEIARHFGRWSPAARRLISAPVSWQKFAITRVDAGGPWTHDRLALLGDAAHAMDPYLAQGAAMAIEDAAILADRLSAVADVPAALRAYEAGRKARVVLVAAAARRVGAQYHYGGLMAFARDAALRLAGERLILERNDWIYRWQPSAPDHAEAAQ